MYERRKQRLLSRAEFSKGVGRHGLVAFGVLLFGLGIGVLGYHWLGDLSWIDSRLNRSMTRGGMGPVDPLKSDAAKIFASCYALFSGLAFIGIDRCCSRRLFIECYIAFTRRSVNNGFELVREQF